MQLTLFCAGEGVFGWDRAGKGWRHVVVCADNNVAQGSCLASVSQLHAVCEWW
jgi:hypothetical protein